MKRTIPRQAYENVKAVLDSGILSSRYGDMTHRFEQAFAEKMNAKYAIAVNSGTSALYLALKACVIGKGDEVIVPALGPTMTAAAVKLAGAEPVFADIDPETYCISYEDVCEKYIYRDEVKAIIPVHIFGNKSETDFKDWYVIEDCAQSLSPLRGDIACYSLEQAKHISTGDGGLIVTSDEYLAKKIRQWSDHGISNITASSGKWEGKAQFDFPGHNMRMPEVIAAIGLAQLETVKPGPLYYTRYIERDDEADLFESMQKKTGIEYARAPWDKLVYQWPMFGGQEGLCPVAERIHPNLFVFPVVK